MAIGRGYFWSGLSRGIEGLYGHTMNQKMAREAQKERSDEGALDRAAAMDRLDKTLDYKPPPDTLNPDYDSAINEQKNVARELEEHDSDLISKNDNPVAWAAKRAGIAKRKRDADARVSGLGKKVGSRQGVSTPGVRKKGAAKSFAEQFMDAERNKGK